jgi:hypothetical protein
MPNHIVLERELRDALMAASAGKLGLGSLVTAIDVFLNSNSGLRKDFREPLYQLYEDLEMLYAEVLNGAIRESSQEVQSTKKVAIRKVEELLTLLSKK